MKTPKLVDVPHPVYQENSCPAWINPPGRLAKSVLYMQTHDGSV